MLHTCVFRIHNYLRSEINMRFAWINIISASFPYRDEARKEETRMGPLHILRLATNENLCQRKGKSISQHNYCFIVIMQTRHCISFKSWIPVIAIVPNEWRYSKLVVAMNCHGARNVSLLIGYQIGALLWMHRLHVCSQLSVVEYKTEFINISFS